MNQERSNAETWVNHFRILAEGYRDLASIKIVKGSSQGISVSITGVLLLTVAIFVLLFTGLGFAWWLGEYMNNIKAGFFMVGGIYLLLLVILLLTSRKLIMPMIRNLIIKKMYEQN
jgi:hypothetical protein